MPLPPEAFFLPATAASGGQRLCLFHPAQSVNPRGLVLYIHPFAEEMNKARRMAALQSRALAQAGFAVLQIDLHGCGDSSGDFGDASWQSWVDDVLLGCQWLRERAGCEATSGAASDALSGAVFGETFNDSKRDVPLWLWGLRAGCLLAVAAAQRMTQPCHFVFWQPPTSGKLLLQQFLRLKVAGELMGGQTKGVMQCLRQQLADGLPVEIAGYMLAPDLACGLEQALLAPPANAAQTAAMGANITGAAPTQRVAWFELSTREDASLSPASAQAISQWQRAGFQVSSQQVQGPSFWQTTEIEDAPALIQATLRAMETADAPSPLAP